MSNVIKHETLDTLQFFLMAPGISAQDVTVNVDCEDSKIYIEAKKSSTAPEQLTEDFDLAIHKDIDVDKKYDVANAQVKVEHGIITITLQVQKDRVVKVHPKDGN